MPVATETRVRVEVFECEIRAIETTCSGGLGDAACGFDIERK